MNYPILISFSLILSAYLLGSIPTGYILARMLKGIDIREHGSGSTGATNVLRIVGKGAAIAVLLIDMLKGAFAVYIVELASLDANLLPTNWKGWLVAISALLAVIGHSKSIWLNFSGGKSAAISLGILLTMNPFVGLGTLVVFLTVLGISKIVSISSISAAIAVNILMWIFNPSIPYISFAIVAAIYVILRHRTNIQRIIAGTEPRIGQTA
ncbi:acyl-phosphate:glycerol-3-phosphate O-acyltransferase PlsY [Geminocystis sp. NIES-3708]|uniref:glycerol-3-phosphate 1-O-acyltransferase PlsY n=1 Tax=Geminocystis sp. NIES-3708 TaxID=1615909 RepID=UPI0005FCB879|nr:glycerol-3-phosphate 1-O-acyltransferase PlsY [Geminocystis sp. NIES-3708]BAQ59738.1 acyl-phosphate:glycerol-3-phosphate O-acyltransferase PlsY [Geminocystis sp. NIES-3708]